MGPIASDQAVKIRTADDREPMGQQDAIQPLARYRKRRPCRLDPCGIAQSAGSDLDGGTRDRPRSEARRQGLYEVAMAGREAEADTGQSEKFAKRTQNQQPFPCRAGCQADVRRHIGKGFINDKKAAFRRQIGPHIVQPARFRKSPIGVVGIDDHNDPGIADPIEGVYFRNRPTRLPPDMGMFAIGWRDHRNIGRPNHVRQRLQDCLGAGRRAQPGIGRNSIGGARRRQQFSERAG